MAASTRLPAAALLTLALLLGAALSGGVAGAKTDGDLLREFKATFSNGDTALASWAASGEPCSGDSSSWEGISCSSGHVTQM